MYPPTGFGDKTAIFREILMQRYTQYQDINLLSTILNLTVKITKFIEQQAQNTTWTLWLLQ
jgi:hypothetical protein